MKFIEQKLSSRETELKKFHIFFVINKHEKLVKNKANSQKILVQMRNILCPVSFLVSLLTHSSSFHYFVGPPQTEINLRRPLLGHCYLAYAYLLVK